MKKALGALVVGALVLTASTILPQAVVADDGSAHFQATVEGIFLGRDDFDGTDFTGPDTVGNPFVEFKPSDIDTGVAYGAQAFLRASKGGHTFEAGAFFARNGGDSRTIFDDTESGTNATYDDDAHLNPGADVTTSNSDDLFALQIEIETNVGGAEGNYIYSVPIEKSNLIEDVGLFAGARFYYFKEKLNSIAFDGPNDFAGTDNDIDRVNIESSNFLVGPQIGIEASMKPNDYLSLGGRVFGGLFANFIERKKAFSSDDLGAANLISDTQSGVAFSQAVGAAPRLAVRLLDQYGIQGYLTVSGMILWMNGVSAAAEYYSTVTDRADTKIRDDENVLFYGGTVGLVISF